MHSKMVFAWGLNLLQRKYQHVAKTYSDVKNCPKENVLRTQTHSIRQSPPADGTDKLIGVILFLVLVQDTLYCVKLER